MNVMNFNAKRNGRNHANSRYRNTDDDLMRNKSNENQNNRRDGSYDKYDDYAHKNIDVALRDLSPEMANKKSNSKRGEKVALSFGRNAGMNMMLERDSNQEDNKSSNRPSVTNNSTKTTSVNQGSSTFMMHPKTNLNSSDGNKNIFNQRNNKKGDLLIKIKKEIMDINEKMLREEKNPDQELTLPERIELLNRLSALMELLKKYYESQRKKGNHNEDTTQKNNFEQVLILIKRLMESLLKRMSDGLIHSQVKTSNKKISQDQTPHFIEEQNPIPDDDHRSLARIGMMTRQLTKDLENLIPPTYEFETLGNTQHASVSHDPRDKEFQSISAINNLLQEVVQNLNNINENMDDNLGDTGNFKHNNNIYNNNMNSMPNSYSDQKTEGSKYGDYIEQSQNKGGLYNKNFMRKKNNSRFTNESDFKNSSLKYNYDPAYQMNLDESKGLSVEMLNFLGILNFKIQKYNRKQIDKSFDLLFHEAVTQELLDKLRRLGKGIKKENFFLSLAKLSVETNRRMHIRNQAMYKLSKSLLIKKKWCLNVLRDGQGNGDFDPTRVSIEDVNAYFGKKI